MAAGLHGSIPVRNAMRTGDHMRGPEPDDAAPMSAEEMERLEAIRRELDREYAEQRARVEDPGPADRPVSRARARSPMLDAPPEAPSRRPSGPQRLSRPEPAPAPMPAEGLARRAGGDRAVSRRARRSRSRLGAVLIATFLVGCLLGAALGVGLTVVLMNAPATDVTADPSRP